METPSSPLEILRQLKEMLDSGALTATEFEALKQRLVFSPPPGPADATPPVAVLPSAVAPPAEEPEATPAPPAATAPPTTSMYVPAPDPLFLPGPSPDFPLPTLQAEHTDEEPDNFGHQEGQLAPAPERSSPLGLILAIGAVLVFLAVVAYLGFNRPPSEHLSSTSQTAADSLNTTIETGPQSAPLPAPIAEPETVRAAPAHPAPALPSPAEMARKAAMVRDSTETSVAPVADSAGR